MIIKGKAHKFGDNVNTDEIIPAKYLNTTDPKELARHCMEGIDKEFSNKVQSGDIIVAGKNFGCGSSREHAPWAIKGCGIAAVVAESFSGIFFRNAINIGLPFVECKDANDIDSENLIEIDLDKGKIKNLTKKAEYNTIPFPQFLKQVIESGGLMNWVNRRAITK